MEKFFMPGIRSGEAVKEWRRLHEIVNVKKEFTIPVESVRYKLKDGRTAIDRVGQLSFQNGKRIKAIVENEVGVAVFTEYEDDYRIEIKDKNRISLFSKEVD